MRSAVVVAWMLLGMCAPAVAEVSIGINLSVYPDLVPVPGYPVYYAPQLDSNFFFYDGLYWVYADDSNWYASAWYNGPWDMVAPELVPLFVLRVPVRYYRRPPQYFRGWGPETPPHWGEHWGHDWEQRRGGWDHWDRASAAGPAPLPTYQREYSGDRYPSIDQQSALRNRNYHYEPRDAVVRQRYQQPHGQAVLEQQQTRTERDRRSTPPPDSRHGRAPVTAEGGVTAGRAESRPAAGGQAADEARRLQGERGRLPQPGNPGAEHRVEHQQVEHQQERPEQGAPPRESQPAHSREHTDRPPPNAPGAEPRQGPERDH
jgi:hypothetical protein